MCEEDLDVSEKFISFSFLGRVRLLAHLLSNLCLTQSVILQGLAKKLSLETVASNQQHHLIGVPTLESQEEILSLKRTVHFPL